MMPPDKFNEFKKRFEEQGSVRFRHAVFVGSTMAIISDPGMTSDEKVSDIKNMIAALKALDKRETE